MEFAIGRSRIKETLVFIRGACCCRGSVESGSRNLYRTACRSHRYVESPPKEQHSCAGDGGISQNREKGVFKRNEPGIDLGISVWIRCLE